MEEYDYYHFEEPTAFYQNTKSADALDIPVAPASRSSRST